MRPWHNLPREVVDDSSLEVVQVRLDEEKPNLVADVPAYCTGL